jgi:hypothetical protein
VLAVFALAFQALLPALVQAQPGAVVSTSICSADGATRTVDLPLAPIDKQGSGTHLKHCALCGGDRGAQAIDASANPVVAAAEPAFERPAARPAALSRGSVLASAQPRAPPV